MKNNNLSKKAKKSIIITSVAAVCIGVVSAVIVNVNSKVTANSDKTIKNPSATIVLSSDVSPNSISDEGGVNTNLGKKTFNPETESSRSEPLTIFSKPSSVPPKPVIEGDSKDGKQPTNSALTDKSKKPTYKTPPKAPTKDNTATKKSSGTSSTSTKKSTGGSTKGNPIIDNAIREQGGNQETTVGNSGDELTGDKVGIMD